MAASLDLETDSGLVPAQSPDPFGAQDVKKDRQGSAELLKRMEGAFPSLWRGLYYLGSLNLCSVLQLVQGAWLLSRPLSLSLGLLTGLQWLIVFLLVRQAELPDTPSPLFFFDGLGTIMDPIVSPSFR